MPVLYDTSKLPPELRLRLEKRLVACSWTAANIRADMRGIERELRKLFRKAADCFRTANEVFCWINSYYSDRYAKSLWKDYPWYLFAMLFMEGEDLKCTGKAGPGGKLLAELHEAVERLLVMAPRDVVRGAPPTTRQGKGHVTVEIDDRMKAMQSIRRFDARYEKFCRRTMFQGASYLTQATYQLQRSEYSPSGCMVGPWEGRPEMRAIFFSPRISESCKDPAVANVYAAAYLTIIDLLANVPSEDRPINDRSKFFAQLVCLHAFLVSREWGNKQVEPWDGFRQEFAQFVLENSFVGVHELDASQAGTSSLTDEDIDRLRRRVEYEKGKPSKRLFDSVDQLEEELSKATELGRGNASDDAELIQPQFDPVTLDASDVDQFLALFFHVDGGASPSTSTENPSEIGFVLDGMLAVPAPSKAQLQIRVLLALDRLMRRVLSQPSGGSVMSDLGIRFQRYVERYLEAHAFHVVRGLDDDPDVIAVLNRTLYSIECKAWLEDIEYTLGVDYVPRFVRRSKYIAKARTQAVRWSEQIPDEALERAGEFDAVCPVVIVPYAVFAPPYTTSKEELDDTPVLTAFDLVRLAQTEAPHAPKRE